MYNLLVSNLSFLKKINHYNILDTHLIVQMYLQAHLIHTSILYIYILKFIIIYILFNL